MGVDPGAAPAGDPLDAAVPDPAGMTAAQAQAAIENVRVKAGQDPGHPLTAGSDPLHGPVVERWRRLHEIAQPADPSAAAPSPDPRAAEDSLRGADAALTEPLGEPGDYVEILHGAHLDPADAIEDVQIGLQTVGGWMSEIGFTAVEAQNVVRAYNTIAAAGQQDDPEARADAARTSEGTLRSLWGADFDANLASAERAIDLIDEDGQLVEFLTTTGLVNDAWVIQALANAAARNGW